jgi:acetyltransferase-like isoleucine patch superfamily enzyme
MAKKIIRIICYFFPIFRRFLLIKIKGSDNTIRIIENGKEYINKTSKIPKGLRLEITGNSNTVTIEMPITLRNSSLEIHSSGKVIDIGKNCRFNNLLILCSAGTGQIVKIGKNSTSEGSVTIRLTYNAKVIIGNDCMFAHDIFIRATDAHTIIDKETGAIINKPKHPLIIGNHCWIGQKCLLAKNTVIPNNSIVGMGSVVTKIFTEAYTAIAGNPAMAVKRNILWDRGDIAEFEKSNQFDNKIDTASLDFIFRSNRNNTTSIESMPKI